MQRFVVEPILFAIFGELLFPQEPVEYIMPYSTINELYELRDSEQIVTDPAQNELAKQNIEKVIAFFEQPFVSKKINRSLRVPWQKSAPILYSEGVTLTVVFALDNAEYGEAFDPIETELLLLAKREQAPIISDQLDFQMRVVEAKLPVTVLDVEDFGFIIEEVPDAAGLEEDDSMLASEPLQPFEADPQSEPKKANTLLPWVMGGFVLLLVASICTLFR
ncbi:MAG: hypothetical protein WCC10_00495 [Tumebacillaceae bacterium]